MKVKHNTQRNLAHYAVYAVHDRLRDERVVFRLIQVNHYAVKRQRSAAEADGMRPFVVGTINISYTMLVRSPKPPKTVIRGLINWKE